MQSILFYLVRCQHPKLEYLMQPSLEIVLLNQRDVVIKQMRPQQLGHDSLSPESG